MLLYHNFLNDSDLTSSYIQSVQDNKHRTWPWLVIKLY